MAWQYQVKRDRNDMIQGIRFSSSSSPEVIKLFSCSTQLSMKLSLLINMKMPTAFLHLLAEKNPCSALFSKKEFAVVGSLSFISMTNFMHS